MNLKLHDTKNLHKNFNTELRTAWNSLPDRNFILLEETINDMFTRSMLETDSRFISANPLQPCS